jgi:uncharacterized tellurite resistance protein B-like protein
MNDLPATVRRVMVLMMMADRRVLTSEIEMMSDVHQRLFGSPLTRADIDREMDAIEIGEPDLDELLAEAAEAFDPEERETIMRAAACVSVADRSLHRDEKILLIRVGSRLGLGPERISSLMAQVE